MRKLILEQFDTTEKLAVGAAAQWLNQIALLGPNSRYCVALSGGRIAKEFFTAIADGALKRSVSMSQVHFFWADERCVPPTDAESNYHLAFEYLLKPLQVPERQIHRIPGEQPPTTAAQSASAELGRLVPAHQDGRPVFDMIFLGMGEDGHVASLFPPVPARSAGKVYVAVEASKPPPNRITLDYEPIRAAKQVWVLVSGIGKEAALRESISDNGQTPLAEVIQSRDETRILTDIPVPNYA